MTGIEGDFAANPKLAQIVQELREIAAKRPSVALAAGKSVRTAETIRRIIAAAHAVFVNEGHAGLSLRMVADEADIAVGNLTYHFATKSELLEAALAERLARYIDEHLAAFEQDRTAPSDILLDVVAFYARNAQESHRFFYQMWGYAGSGDAARDYVRSLYRPIGRLIFRLVRAANPDLDYAEARRAVLQIFSLEEGYKLFTGLGPEDDLALATAERDIRDLTQAIVFGQPKTNTRGGPVEQR